jgi:hypothetical protein
VPGGCPERGRARAGAAGSGRQGGCMQFNNTFNHSYSNLISILTTLKRSTHTCHLPAQEMYCTSQLVFALSVPGAITTGNARGATPRLRDIRSAPGGVLRGSPKRQSSRDGWDSRHGAVRATNRPVQRDVLHRRAGGGRGSRVLRRAETSHICMPPRIRYGTRHCAVSSRGGGSRAFRPGSELHRVRRRRGGARRAVFAFVRARLLHQRRNHPEVGGCTRRMQLTLSARKRQLDCASLKAPASNTWLQPLSLCYEAKNSFPKFASIKFYQLVPLLHRGSSTKASTSAISTTP